MPRRVCVPLEAGSTPSPGRTEAIGAVASTVGTWTGRVPATPVRELVSTMSFWSHPRRKRQSLPAADSAPSAAPRAGRDGGDGCGPHEPVPRAADGDRRAGPEGEADRGREPDVVARVVADGRIARALEGAGRRRSKGEAGQQAGAPALSRVARG